MTVPLSILDLAPIAPGETVARQPRASVALARRAEAAGYRRVWYAEHHNMASIASSATSVLIAHVAAHTRTIRLGAGGDHAAQPLAAHHRRAVRHARRRCTPGASTSASGARRAATRTRRTRCAATRSRPTRSPRTCWSCRPTSAGETLVPGCRRDARARARDVPLYILGSSLFGAQLAAALGLPYAFASHFAPDAARGGGGRSTGASSARRSSSTEPYVIAGVNVVAADDADDAQAQLHATLRARVPRASSGRGQTLHRRGGRRGAGLAAGPADRADDDLRRGRHAGRGRD